MNIDNYEFDDYYEDVILQDPDQNIDPLFWYELDLEYAFF